MFFVLSLWVSARAQNDVPTILPISDSIIVTVTPLPKAVNTHFSEYACRLLRQLPAALVPNLPEKHPEEDE